MRRLTPERTWDPASVSTAWTLSFLLTGEEAAATGALQEGLEGAESDPALEEAVSRAALRRAAHLPPDRFFLRALAHPPLAGDLEADLRQRLDRQPQPERAALILQAVAGLADAQIAALLRLDTSAVGELLRRGWERLRPALDAAEPAPNRAPDAQAALQARLRQALLAQVPPLPAELLTGRRPEAAPLVGRPNPLRSRPSLLLLAGALLVGLILLQWPGFRGKPAPPATDPLEPVLVTTALPKPSFTAADLQRLDPGTIVEIDTRGFADLRSFTNGERLVLATKLVQWMGEAEVLPPIDGPAPTVDDGPYPELVLWFADGWRMWIQPEGACVQSLTDCAIEVMVDGRSLRLRQIDLVQYFAGLAWASELRGVPTLLRGNWAGELHLTAQQVAELLVPAGAASGMKIQVIEPRSRLLQHQEADGRWRTALAPAWVARLEPGDPAQGGGVILVVDDETEDILFRLDEKP